MRSLVVAALAVYDALAVENPAFPGTPDVNCTLGWIELKQHPCWPRITADRPVLCPKFTPQQRVWLIRRTRAGGIADLLWKIGQEWLLFDGQTAARIVGRVCKAELLRSALALWPSNQIMKESLPVCLYRRATSRTESVCVSGDDGRASLSPPPRSATG
jgi:hypothetical protein